MIGDFPSDIAASRKGGLQMTRIASGYPFSEKQADHIAPFLLDMISQLLDRDRDLRTLSEQHSNTVVEKGCKL